MAEMAPIESHRFTSAASRCSRSPSPVFFLYWLKAPSMIELKSEDGELRVWPTVDEDIMLATVILLVMVAESSRKQEA